MPLYVSDTYTRRSPDTLIYRSGLPTCCGKIASHHTCKCIIVTETSTTSDSILEALIYFFGRKGCSNAACRRIGYAELCHARGSDLMFMVQTKLLGPQGWSLAVGAVERAR